MIGEDNNEQLYSEYEELDGFINNDMVPSVRAVRRDTEGCSVSNPAHYTVGGFEALDVIRAKLTREEYIGYCKGNALKYLMRANYKGYHDNDCSKASYYLVELEEILDEEETEQQGKWDSPLESYDEIQVREACR